jgi:hypothetical protein
VLLDKGAVQYLQKWGQETQPAKATYEQLREHIAAKFDKANVLPKARAAWALDAWATALNLYAVSAGDAARLTLQPLAPSPTTAAEQAQANAAEAAWAAARAKAAADKELALPARHAEAPAQTSAEGGDPAPGDGVFVPWGRSLSAGRGLAWFVEAWNIFKQHPFIWLVNIFLMGIFSWGVNLIPVIGLIFALVNLILPCVWFAGIIFGADAVRRGQPLRISHTFAGFTHGRFKSLVLLGILSEVVVLLVIILAVVLLHLLLLTWFASSGTTAASMRQRIRERRGRQLLGCRLQGGLRATPIARMWLRRIG